MNCGICRMDGISKLAVGKCTCEWQVPVCHEHMLSAAACGFRPVTLWSHTEMTPEEAAALAVQLCEEGET